MTVMAVPSGTFAPLSCTVPWKAQGGVSDSLPDEGGVFNGVGVGTAVGVGVGVGVGTTVGVGVGATVGIGVGVGVEAVSSPQPRAPKTSTSTANGINTTAIFFILPPSI